MGVLWASWGLPGNLLGNSWEPPGASRGRPGCLLEPPGGLPGLLGASWVSPAASLGYPGALLGGVPPGVPPGAILINSSTPCRLACRIVKNPKRPPELADSRGRRHWRQPINKWFHSMAHAPAAAAATRAVPAARAGARIAPGPVADVNARKDYTHASAHARTQSRTHAQARKEPAPTRAHARTQARARRPDHTRANMHAGAHAHARNAHVRTRGHASTHARTRARARTQARTQITLSFRRLAH